VFRMPQGRAQNTSWPLSTNTVMDAREQKKEHPEDVTSCSICESAHKPENRIFQVQQSERPDNADHTTHVRALLPQICPQQRQYFLEKKNVCNATERAAVK
jgi:hypothetical protein